MKHQRLHVDQIYLYVKDAFESKYQFLINKREKGGIKNEEKSKVFIDYSQLMMFVNLDNYNPTNRKEVLIIFDDMIEDVEANKKLKPIVTEFFMRGRNATAQLFLYHNLILQKTIYLPDY